MKFRNIKLLLSFAIVLTVLDGYSQQLVRDEYRAEIGISAGAGFYLGDANATIFSHIQPVVGGMFRYKVNQRIAYRFEITHTNISGNGLKNNGINTLDFCGEFNFFDLEQNPYKRYSKTYSPYIFTGLSMMTGVYNSQILPVMGIPFGVGLKVKLSDRLNLNLQCTNRIMFVDNLEGTTKPKVSDKYNNPNNLNGSNILNNDMVSAFTIGITLDIWKRQCECLNSYNRR